MSTLAPSSTRAAPYGAAAASGFSTTLPVPNAAQPTSPVYVFGSRPRPAVAPVRASIPAPAPAPAIPITTSKSDDGKSQSRIDAGRFASNLLSSTINVKFPCNGREYHLHEALLVHNSGYFKHMLSSGMQEQQRKTVTLNYTEPFEIAFRSVVHYMYCGTYSVKGAAEHTIRVDPDNTALVPQQEQADHIHIYVLADRLLIPDLKSIALANFMQQLPLFQRSITPSIVHIPYLAKVLYDDVIDQVEDETNESQQISKADDDGEPQSDNGVSTQEQILRMKDDPRRAMQQHFAELVQKDFGTLRKSLTLQAVLFEGGPFVLDLISLLDA